MTYALDVLRAYDIAECATIPFPEGRKLDEIPLITNIISQSRVCHNQRAHQWVMIYHGILI